MMSMLLSVEVRFPEIAFNKTSSGVVAPHPKGAIPDMIMFRSLSSGGDVLAIIVKIKKTR
jgi:hypothetical protein